MRRFAAHASFVVLLALFMTNAADAQRRVAAAEVVADTALVYTITVRDGSRVVGRVTDASADSVWLATQYGVLTIPRASIDEVHVASIAGLRSGRNWAPSPNATRLFFAPTGRTLPKGEGYFADHYLLLLSVAGGITDRFTMGGGMSIVPTGSLEDFMKNVFFLTPKVGLVQSENVNVAVGTLIGATALEDVDGAFGVAFGVGTFGPPDRSVTAGIGWGYGTKDGFADEPVAMIGGDFRLSRRTSFITENYYFPWSDGFPVISYGMRIFGEKLAVDLGFFNSFADGGGIVPGIPYIDFVVVF